MTSFFEKLNILKNTLHLESARKKALGQELLNFIHHLDAVRAIETERHIQQRSGFLFNNPLLKPMPLLAIVTIFATLTGGVSFAAENALPGDILYPVKVNFNEEVRAALSFTPEAKAEWETRRAERRLEEATEISASGTINNKERVELEENFKEHADKVNARIDEFEEKGNLTVAADVANRFETSLKAHQEILARFESDDRAVQAEIKPLKKKVNDELDDISKTRIHIESRIATHDGKPETKTAAEGKLKAAINNIATTRNFIELRKENLGADATTEAEVKLKNAENLVLEGRAKIDAGTYGEAFNLANRAMRMAQEVRLIIEAEAKMNAKYGRKNLQIDLLKKKEVGNETDVKKESDDENKNTGNEETKNSLRVETEGNTEIQNGGAKSEGELRLHLGL